MNSKNCVWKNLNPFDILDIFIFMNGTLKKLVVVVCSNCQQEYPEIKKQMASRQREITFSHSYCPRHFSMRYANIKDLTPEEQQIVQKNLEISKNVPDLSQHPELVQSYVQGNFFPQIQPTLKERLQKLANIKNDNE